MFMNLLRTSAWLDTFGCVAKEYTVVTGLANNSQPTIWNPDSLNKWTITRANQVDKLSGIKSLVKLYEFYTMSSLGPGIGPLQASAIHG